MNLRTQLSCCVLGAMIAAVIAVNAAVVLLTGVASKDGDALELKSVPVETTSGALEDQAARNLMTQLSANMRDYSELTVKAFGQLAGLLHKQAVTALVGGTLCFLLFSYVGFALWKREKAT